MGSGQAAGHNCLCVDNWKAPSHGVGMKILPHGVSMKTPSTWCQHEDPFDMVSAMHGQVHERFS